ncbi:hypothetical protein C8R43DRAFT_1077027 [Mycena crocata]|nr:hypothetical protein C8R43DRAFT_1077027 [Mycena crocata]
MPPVNTHHNPFDVWSNAGSGHANNHARHGHASASAVSPPSVFGALPYPNPPVASASGSHTRSNSSLTTFYLTSLNPSVLNCVVLGPAPGPQNQHHPHSPAASKLYYAITTDNTMPGYTVFKNAARKSIGLIEWQRHPRVEVRGAVPKQETRGWLKVSRDQTYRTMTIRGFKYTWAPDGQYINLCSSGPSPQFLGRISRGEDSVAIELTPDAIQLELLDTAVVVAVLLQCGHNID